MRPYIRFPFIILLIIMLVVSSCDENGNDVVTPSNQAPEIPSNPEPSDNSTITNPIWELRWSCSDPDGDSLTYDVYLGKDSVSTDIYETVPDTFLQAILEWGKNYKWKVIARDPEAHSSESPIWTFSTEINLPPEVPVPFPINEPAAITQILLWTCFNQELEPIVYDVYFGKEENPPLVSEGQMDSYYTPGYLLDGGTQYFWKIDAIDEYGNRTSSPIWSFLTTSETSFPLANSDLMVEMVWIPPGSFYMGAQSGDSGAMGDEYPRHYVTIENGFWMGKYEVTQEQWIALLGDWNFHFDNNPHRPAENISWNSINNNFIETLNVAVDENVWRLPTESEWEYACRAGVDYYRFWWGNDVGYSQLDDYAWYWDNNDLGNGHETQDVGQKTPNPWGLYDMHGNVWEWCEDDYHLNYQNAPSDGSAWIDNSGNGKIARGGGWGEYGAQFCRSSARGRDNPAYGYPIFGFRLVRD